MKGETPQPPKGWDDNSSSNDGGNSKAESVEDKPSSDSKIGGPAGEH